jgi:HAD superfamily hydrolase (TIGR01509 family)
VTDALAAVFFDMDGLLIDSEPIWSIAEAEIMEWLGGPWNLEVKAACLGKRVDESCRNLVAIAGSTRDPAEVVERLLGRMCELYRQHLPWHHGARELVDGLRAAGVPTALVSSSFRVLVDTALHEMGAHRFDVTIAGDEVTNAKPHPEPYLSAAERLGVDPRRCVVFEDSLTGVLAAEAAGCLAVAVPDVVPVERADRRPVLDSLADVDLDWLRSLPEMSRI